MTIRIIQGTQFDIDTQDIVVVIDVIRAFTTARFAFLGGAKKIYLAAEPRDAFGLKESLPSLYLAGEIRGLPIEGFDFGNSPKQVQQANLIGASLVLKTTNGVTAVLSGLAGSHKRVLACGFADARAVANRIRQLHRGEGIRKVTLVASSPGSEDLACAHYIKSLTLGLGEVGAGETKEKIASSAAATKFLDNLQPEFDPEDLQHCLEERTEEFVMEAVREKYSVLYPRFVEETKGGKAET